MEKLISPLETKTVTVGGQQHVLKLSFYAEFLLSEYEVDTKVLGKTLFGGSPKAVREYVNVFAALVAHEYVAMGVDPPTPEQWAQKLTQEDFTEIVKAVPFVMFKRPTPAVEPPSQDKLAAERPQ